VDDDFNLDSWLVQPSLNTVSRNGTTFQLEPKVISVLVCLAESPGQPVSKEKLLQTVWPDTFVGEGVLVRSISELRRVFEDDPKEPRVIQTIAKRGYRLVAPLAPLNGTRYRAPGNGLVATSNFQTRNTASRRPIRVGILISLGMAVLLVATLAFSPDKLWQRFQGATRASDIRSLAVLPLRNLSGDPGQEYFTDVMTEELITELSRVSDLKVISRTSVMRYKNTDKSLPQIARELGVNGIVAGSVLRSGDRVRISAQLIDARTDTNLWAETYDRGLQDTLAVQEAVATAIAGKTKTSLIPVGAIEAKAPRVVNFEAHEAYLLGLHEWGHIHGADHDMEASNREHNMRAKKYFQDALRKDPDYAPVYVALARVVSDNGEGLTEVESNLRKAVELDDSLSEAHVLLGALLLFRDLNWRSAEKEIVRAIEVNPNSTQAHESYAYLLDAQGRMGEGLKEYQRAQELDPANDHLGGALYARREYDSLIAMERRALATSAPGREGFEDAIAHKVLMVAYARTGRRKESIEEFRAALVGKGFAGLAEDVSRGYLRGGYEGAWRAYLLGRRRTDFSFGFVDIYAYTELGEYDEVFARLPNLNNDDPGEWDWQANSDGVSAIPSLATLRLEPMWDPLHSDPRFEALARRVGLPAAPASSGKP
jgi:TolB-like protein/DNA-binding winged helix-turn-helix (wHTH) protein/tetratricopeptide (TPR) repeat protein